MPEPPPERRGADEPARTVAELLADQAARGGSIVLTGGSTPARAYRLAASLEPDWGRGSVWWGDERCVPPDDERSNFRLTAENPLDRPHTPPGGPHPTPGRRPPRHG